GRPGRPLRPRSRQGRTEGALRSLSAPYDRRRVHADAPPELRLERHAILPRKERHRPVHAHGPAAASRKGEPLRASRESQQSLLDHDDRTLEPRCLENRPELPSSRQLRSARDLLRDDQGRWIDAVSAPRHGTRAPPALSDAGRERARGGEPAVHFEIHYHSGPYNYTEYYSIPLALRDDDSWTVPTADTYMVLWSNPSTKFVNVTYNFTLLAPPPDLTVFVVFPVILGVIVLLLWVARKRPHRPGPKESRLQK